MLLVPVSVVVLYHRGNNKKKESMSSEEKSETSLKSEKSVKKERRGSIGKMFGRSEKTSNSVDSDSTRPSPKPSRRSSRDDVFAEKEALVNEFPSVGDKKMTKAELGQMMASTRADIEKRVNKTDAHLYEQDQKINQMSMQVTSLMKNSAMSSQLLIDVHTWMRAQQEQEGHQLDQGFVSPSVQLRADKEDGNCPSCTDVLFFWRDS